MRSVSLLLLLACVVFAAVASAKPIYQAELPNLPVVEGAVWPGVGHVARGGGGSRNAFGLAFAAAGHKWTAALCQMDSDGDGFSNGVELGDPDCRWVKGQPSPGTGPFSHPGLATSVPRAAAPVVGRR